uniref:Uncharacterized protein n=1 Tax=Heliothis virescens TaxID=7102 RepID=A0A2A4K4Y0_HELVI
MKDYITTETATVILERRQIKEGGLSTKEKRDHYAQLSNEVQRRCRNDYNTHINNMCCELEEHAKKNETRDLFRKVRDLTGTRKVKTCVIEDEEGHLLTDVEQVLDRWKRYCKRRKKIRLLAQTTHDIKIAQTCTTQKTF